MFKRRTEHSVKSTVFQFGFKIFFVHIMNIVIMFVFLLIASNFSISSEESGITYEYEQINIILTAICFIFYVCSVYVESWRTGLHDYNLVLYKRIDYNKYKALYAALISQVPGLILAILMLFPGRNFEIQRYARYFYVNFIYPLSILDDGYNMRAAYFIPVSFALVPALLGYFLGYRGKRLLDKIMFVRPKRDGRKRDNLR